MSTNALRCVSCQQQFPLVPLYECEHCAGILEVTYDYSMIDKTHFTSQPSSITKDYINLLPIQLQSSASVYAGEGQTALVEAKRLAQRIGMKRILLKCEFSNPSGAFKDRPVSVGVAKALEFGYEKIIVASSGNGAASVAAYAARAGLDAIVLVPESTPIEKVTQAQSYGAIVIRIKGPYSNCFNLAKVVGEKFNMFNLTTTFINPYTLEGDKTVTYELLEQMQGSIPDVIYVPIGAGPLLVGILKGYREYQLLHPEAQLPRMAGIQAKGCSPIARAFLAGDEHVQAEENPQTIAGGICDGLHGYSKDGTHTLNNIKQSNGFSSFVSDSEIIEAQKWLAQDEGLFVESSAAVGIAGLYKSLREGRISESDEVVVILTGHGLKEMSQMKATQDVPLIPNDVNQLIMILRTT